MKDNPFSERLIKDIVPESFYLAILGEEEFQPSITLSNRGEFERKFVAKVRELNDGSIGVKESYGGGPVYIIGKMVENGSPIDQLQSLQHFMTFMYKVVDAMDAANRYRILLATSLPGLSFAYVFN